MRMPPRTLAAVLSLLALAALAGAVACGGDDDDSQFTQGQLSDPNDVPTATPWQVPPDVFILDPENLQPLPPDQPVTDGDSTPTPEAGEPGVCGETYTVAAGDTTFDIAEKCGVSVEEIEALNPDVDIRSLTIGQVLIMPTPEATDSEESE